MTTPRDALGALEQNWRKSASNYTDRESVRLRLCADELAAIVIQMDSEPTVAQWREPTDEMLDAGAEALKDRHKTGSFGECPGLGWGDARACYEAMIAELTAKDKP